MAPDETEKKPKIVNKKHLARVEKENNQRRILKIAIIAVVVIVVGLITYGILDSTVLKNIKPVAKVGSTTITVEQFEKRVKFDRQQMISQYMAYATSPYAMFFQSSLVSVQDSLDNYVQFGSDTLDQMVNEAVLVEKAKSMGITVSDAEVEKYLEDNFGYYPNGTPTTAPTRKVEATPTYSATQLALLGPTPTVLSPTVEPTATSTELPTATAEVTTEGTLGATATATLEPPTATPTQTETPTAVPTITLTPTITMTPTPYTYQGFEELYKTSVASINSTTGFTDQDLRAYVKNILIGQKVVDQITKEIPQVQEVVWARHILVQTEAEAQAVLDKLKAGEDFATLAAQVSIDTGSNTNGGDLGWFIRGQMVKPFEDAAFSMQIGQISDPIKTDNGYHIIQVLGHVTRTLTDDEFNTARQIAYNNFLTQAKTEISIKKYNIWASVVPAEPTIPAQYRTSSTN